VPLAREGLRETGRRVGPTFPSLLCVTAYAFLVAERCRFSPQGWRPRLQAPERPAGYRSGGTVRAGGTVVSTAALMMAQ
jgi:hypothetical protein